MSADPMSPVTRAELHAELGDVRETLARIVGRLDVFDERMDHLASREFVLDTMLKGVLAMAAVFVALLSLAVGVMLKYG